MALLDASPKKVRDYQYRENVFSWSTGALVKYRVRNERIYEWAADDTGGETTHEGTYEVDDHYFEEGGLDIAHDAPHGIWREIYRTRPVWTFPT